ncbi:MAG TPA: hypothetical protein VMG33_04875 [Steroidobacteraceae bacterium]|nr:hypothetical protein [Steroidobacteraceae bacterium]
MPATDTARRAPRAPPAGIWLAWLLLALQPLAAFAQISPDEANEIRNAIGNRVEALSILAGDYGITGGDFRTTGKFQGGETIDAEMAVTKLGGAGDFGMPRPVGDLAIGWQGRLQGNMGYIEATNHLHSPLLEGDVSTFREYALEFGGGVRLWVSDGLSLAPTVLGIYGHTVNDYTAHSPFMQANLARAIDIGLVNWSVDTWTLRPALNIQYLITWERTRIKLSTEPAYYHTESFKSSNPNLTLSGDSQSIASTVDVDIPLGVELFGHELRSGGGFEHTDFFGDLKTGLNVSHINEIEGRLVLDFLNQLWKAQWIGASASYVWGTNFTGWTAGLDIVFRF